MALKERVANLEERLFGDEDLGLAARFVKRLAGSWKLRALVLGVWVVLFGVGAPLYIAFPQLLAISIEPPPDSASGLAKTAYANQFDPDPIQVVVMMSSPTPMILPPSSGLWVNESCKLCPFYPHFPFSNRTNVTCPEEQCGFANRTLPAAGPAIAASHVLHEQAREPRVATASRWPSLAYVRPCPRWQAHEVLDGNCKFVFVSYWELALLPPASRAAILVDDVVRAPTHTRSRQCVCSGAALPARARRCSPSRRGS